MASWVSWVSRGWGIWMVSMVALGMGDGYLLTVP